MLYAVLLFSKEKRQERQIKDFNVYFKTLLLYRKLKGFIQILKRVI